MECEINRFEQSKETRQTKILIVDDEKAIRTIFKLALSLEMPDSLIDLASNGVEAVHTYKEGRHDIMLMDLHMPVKDGYTAFLEIQEICNKEGSEMPSVVFCTGYGAPKSLEDIVSRSSRHCILHKPVTPTVLVANIKARVRTQDNDTRHSRREEMKPAVSMEKQYHDERQT